MTRCRVVPLGFIGLVFLLVIELLGNGQTSLAQQNGTVTPTVVPTLPSHISLNLATITKANANRLSPIAVLSPSQNLFGATWSPDGTMLAVYGQQGIWLYTLSNLTSPRFLKSDDGASTIMFSPDGKYLASQSAPPWSTRTGDVTLWALASGEEVALLPNVISPLFASDGVMLIVRDLDYGASRLLFWDIAHNIYRVALPDVSQAVISSDGNTIASVENKANHYLINLRDARTGTLTKTLSNSTQSIGAVAFDSSGRFLAATMGYTETRVWDIASGRAWRFGTSDFRDENPDVQLTVFFSRDGTLVARLATPVGHQALTDIWSLSTGQHIAYFLTDYGAALYFADKTVLAIDDNRANNTYLRGDVTGGKLEGAFPKFNPAQTLLATYRPYTAVFLYGVQ